MNTSQRHPEPFSINITQSKIDDLHHRLKRVNWPTDYANEDWGYGTNRDYLQALTGYWLEEYSWRAQEEKMNTFNHFKVVIEDIPIHFIHQKGVGPNPKPLILTHGWPWTFWDFRKVIGPLSDPAAHGGNPEDAFDVVVPSLPGFVFSSPLRKPGVNWWRTADIWAVLMRDILGYKQFFAHGGDWGSLVTLQLGHRYADQLRGVHVSGVAPLSLFSGERPWAIGGALDGLPQDSSERAAMLAWEKKFASHVAVQHLDPQTLAYAMHDSPLGLCAWLVERRRNWGDCKGNVEARFSRDDLLNNVMLYWLTDSFVNSARFYQESSRQPWHPDHDRMPVVSAPTGITLFEPDMAPVDMSWSEHYCHCVQTRVHPSGGHFAAAEEPEILVKDLCDMFRQL